MEKEVEARVARECNMGDQRDDDIVFGRDTQTGSTKPKLQYNEPHNDAMPIYGFESRGGLSKHQHYKVHATQMDICTYMHHV